jgi:predicted DNA-binding transcriptional regulator YafY
MSWFCGKLRDVRASRLVELLVRLQVQGSCSATELAESLGVSVRTIYRDVEALMASGVPLYTEVGRNGGIRIDPSYRVGGLPRLDVDEARGLLFGAIPAIADRLGFDASIADTTLLPAMERSAESAARIVKDRLLIEPSHWFIPTDDTPVLADVARAVWESRELRLTYRGKSGAVTQPVGLILKGDTWYLMGLVRRGSGHVTRLYRVSRIDDVDVLDHRFMRPTGFNLAEAWLEQRRSFFASLPDYRVTVRVSPTGESLLALLDEGSPPLPLPDDVERDDEGWAIVELRFERTPAGAARHLLQLGADIEVLHPPELRDMMASTAASFVRLYGER